MSKKCDGNLGVGVFFAIHFKYCVKLTSAHSGAHQSCQSNAFPLLVPSQSQIHLTISPRRLSRSPPCNGRPPPPAGALVVRLHAAARAVACRPRHRAPRRVHAEHIRHLLQVPHRPRHGPGAAPPLRASSQAPRPPCWFVTSSIWGFSSVFFVGVMR